MKLSLSFLTKNQIELTRVEFERASGETLVCYRGKGAGIDPSAGSFQWTSAVKAFALLAVATRLDLMHATNPPFVLSGEEKSPASSLDYSISKPTEWIVDMFGLDNQERPYALRVFNRQNTERKLPGPVSIELSKSLHLNANLRIFLDRTEAISSDTLTTILENLLTHFPDYSVEQTAQYHSLSNSENTPDQSLADTLTKLELIATEVTKDSNASMKILNIVETIQKLPHPLPWHAQSSFRDAIQEDVTAALAETELFEEHAIVEAKSRLGSYDWFARCTAHIEDLFKNHPAMHERYAFDESALFQMRKSLTPITVACTSMALPAIIVLRYLELVQAFPISTAYYYPSSSSIIQDAQKDGSVTAMLLSWGAASRLESPDFCAQMLMPRTSFDLIAPETGESTPTPESIALSCDESGYPWLYYTALKENKEPLVLSLQAQDASIADISHRIRSKNGAAILGFPYSLVACLYHGYSFHKRGNPLSRVGDNLLFARSSTHEQQQNNTILRKAIRAAWFALLEDPALLASLVNSLLLDEEYTRYLKRIGSLYKIELR
jgi:hypothetical protein